MPMLSGNSITEVIRQRRSIFPKDYSGESVDAEHIELMLENAHWAPNHGRTEPWHFVVLHSEDARKTFGEAHAQLYQMETPTEDFKQDKFEKLRRRPLECACLIMICMKRGSNPKIPEIEEIEAVACAVQNMHLTATGLGIGAYWSTGGMVYHDGMKKLLDLGEEDKCLGMMMIGMPGRGWPEGRRNSEWRDHVEWK
ncbi:nitroreductase [Pontibacter sp. G13]|uniref:nitroreductase family protein n=1 Tax=Pontibacter sp. G13 TaxID=3074898 RepID=UPI00288C2AEA|nr:nitroreductase [Pontibacter sp. G13]WNJ21273.1 nitroreductase [Pontibacter sp. G13]